MFIKIKSKEIKLWQHECFDGSHSIGIDNIGIKAETMKKCGIITQYFAKGDEMYFGFFRTDGFNLTNEEFQRFDKEIPKYLLDNGRYEEITHTIQKRRKLKVIGSYHAVSSLPMNTMTYEMLPKLFHYHLETTFFCPKIERDTFVQS